MFRSIVYGIRNLVYWLPVVWRSGDYDDHFLWMVIQHQIKAMRNHIHKHRMHLEWEKDVRHMDTVVYLLGRILRCKYSTNAYIRHEKRWGKPVSVWLPTERETTLRWEMMYPKANTWEEQDRAAREAHKSAEHARYLENQDFEMFFDLLRKYSRDWWC